jgi:DNA-binding PucR family transcriptional regulator
MSEVPKDSADLCAGIAGPVLPESLAAAHESARIALSTAWSLGLSGAYTTADLGLLAAVSQVPDVGVSLRQKYLAPLHGAGVLGPELLSTVRAYLEAGSRRDGAGARLHIHINTVGYRLTRFTELTGADLTDFTTLAELWWLFADLDQRPE